MKKLLIVCGSTATGKTDLALHLAKKLMAFSLASGSVRGASPAGELISADSRQVYRWMNIGTGKDLPDNSRLLTKNLELGGCYLVDKVKIWGYDLVKPTEQFSAGQYIKIAQNIINDIHKRKKLSILVGGTGLYIKGVVDGIETANIPQNKSLRRNLEKKSATKLFDILARIDPVKAASMNESDRKNPRRLVRAIEVADYSLKNTGGESVKQVEADVLFIGLKMPKKLLDERIKTRVHKRVRQGIENEITILFKKGVTWEHQSMDALGYKQWREYFEGKFSKEDVIDKWVQDEINYARRQMTWFKKDKRINWFDVTKNNWTLSVEKLVNKWYKDSK
jgi:tRNA dimethylallyltransferase